MDLFTTMKSHIKEAMKNKDINRKDVLKMVIDKAQAIVKEKNPTSTVDVISDDILIQAVQKEMKQLEQTSKILVENGKENSELYTNSAHKIAILNEYLPKQMTREEVESVVNNILSNSDYPNFGLKMKACMTELRGKADNKLIKEVVETYK